MTLPVVCFSGGKPAASAQEQHCTCKPAACTCSTAQHSAEQHVTSTCLPTPPLRSKSAMLGGKAPLHVLRDGEEPLVLLLATLGADVNVRDDNGDTPLSCACAHGAWLAVTLCVGATCHSGMVPSLPDADQAWQHDISCNAVQAACAPPPSCTMPWLVPACLSCTPPGSALAPLHCCGMRQLHSQQPVSSHHNMNSMAG
jgi:hypothetical protein